MGIFGKDSEMGCGNVKIENHTKRFGCVVLKYRVYGFNG